MNQYTPAESAGAIYHRCPMNVIKFLCPPTRDRVGIPQSVPGLDHRPNRKDESGQCYEWEEQESDQHQHQHFGCKQRDQHPDVEHKRFFGVMFHKRGFVFNQIYQQRQQQWKKHQTGMAQD